MRTALGRRAYAVVVGCMLVGHARSAWADCTKDTDCKGDRICTAGACTDPAPAPELAPLPPGLSSPETPPPPETTGQPSAPPRAGATSVDPTEDDLVPADASATKPRSPSMATAGIVLTVTGAIALVATTVLAVKGIADESSSLSALNTECVNQICSANDAQQLQQQRSADQLLVGAYLSGIATAALLGSGIPLYFVGSHQVPVHPPATAWWVPERVSASLRQVTLTYGF